MAFVHNEDFETPDFTIDDIAKTVDIVVLREWYDGIVATRDDIKAQIEAALLTGLYDADWMERVKHAYAFAGMGSNRLKVRLRALGHNVDFAITRPDTATALKIGLEQSKRNCAKAQAAAAFGRHLLAAMRDALPEAAVSAITAEAASRAAAGEALEDIAA